MRPLRLLTCESAQYVEMFGCDTARISRFDDGKLFLILGWNRHTKDDEGQWYKDGEPPPGRQRTEQPPEQPKAMQPR